MNEKTNTNTLEGHIVFTVLKNDSEITVEEDHFELELTDDEQRQVWLDILLTAASELGELSENRPLDLYKLLPSVGAAFDD